MKKKRTFWRNALALAIRTERWYANPKNIDKVIVLTQWQLQISFVCLLFIFVSCSGTKKVTETKLKESVKTETEVSKDLSKKTDVSVVDKSEMFSDKEIATIEKLTEDWEQTVTKYDTSKDIVPGTGKPPVMSETIITHKKASDKDTKIKGKEVIKNNLQVDAKTSLKLEIDSMQKENAKLIAETEQKEIPAGVMWWAWVSLGVLLSVGAWVWWKVMR